METTFRTVFRRWASCTLLVYVGVWLLGLSSSTSLLGVSALLSLSGVAVAAWVYASRAPRHDEAAQTTGSNVELAMGHGAESDKAA